MFEGRDGIYEDDAVFAEWKREKEKGAIFVFRVAISFVVYFRLKLSALNFTADVRQFAVEMVEGDGPSHR